MCLGSWRKSLIKILGPKNVGIHGDIYIISLDMTGWLERPFSAQEDGVWSAEREHEIRAEGGTGVKTRATTAWARFERSTTVPQPKALSLN